MVKLIKFCIVGGINTLISLLTFYVLNKIMGFSYMLSSVIGYACGMINSYILNKTWTFSDTNKRIILQLIKFIFVNGVSLGINLLTMYILVDRIHIDSMIAQVIATGFSTSINYLGSRALVFNCSEKNEQLV
jgi:putative flippase GtrA